MFVKTLTLRFTPRIFYEFIKFDNQLPVAKKPISTYCSYRYTISLIYRKETRSTHSGSKQYY
jgi:hypothetical protein